MQVNRDRSDHHGHERLWRKSIHQLAAPTFNQRPTPQIAKVIGPVARPRHLSDAILKCLHRDDPMRHKYLRRRWQAS